MNVKNEPGMLERIQEAVQPLTRGGEFRLNTIKYGTYFGDIRIDLDSKYGYSLIISKGESNNYITFSFYVDNLSIRSEILFNVLDLSWPFQKNTCLMNYTIFVWVFNLLYQKFPMLSLLKINTTQYPNII